MQIYPVFSKRDQCRKRQVPQSLLEEMERECRQKLEANNPGVGVLGLVPSFYRLDGVEQDNAPAPSAIAIPANGRIIRGFNILWNALLTIDKQLATIMNKRTIPPIKNSSEHPIVVQNCSTHSPDNSNAGNLRQESMIFSISPDTVKV